MRDQERCATAEPLADFEDRTRQAVRQLCDRSHAEGGKTVAVVAHSAVISALICHCLGLPEVEESLSLFRTDAGSVTVVHPSAKQSFLHTSTDTRAPLPHKTGGLTWPYKVAKRHQACRPVKGNHAAYACKQGMAKC